MFGEIFSLKNILIFLAIMFSISIVMNSFSKGTKNNKENNVEEQFSKNEVKEMFTDVKKIKSNLGKLTEDLKELTEKLNPALVNLDKNKSLKKSKMNKKKNDDTSGDDSENEKIKNLRKKNKNNFEEKFTGYKSQYGKDYLLLDH